MKPGHAPALGLTPPVPPTHSSFRRVLRELPVEGALRALREETASHAHGGLLQRDQQSGERHLRRRLSAGDEAGR